MSVLQTQQIGPKTILCGHLLNWEAYKDQSKTHWGLNSAALWLSRRKNIKWGCKGVCKPRMDLDLSWVTLPDTLLPSTNAELAAKHRIVVLPGNWFTHKDVSISPHVQVRSQPQSPQPEGDDSHSLASVFWWIEIICQFCICCCQVTEV